MLRRILQTCLFAGVLTALAYSFVQAVTVTPLIFQAELYEEQAESRDQAHGEAGVVAGQSHDDGDESAVWVSEDGIERYGFTFLANLVTATGFAFVLVAALMVRGRAVDARSGLFWGLSGFLVFAFMPALGLPPEVPGAAAPPLDDRQIWYAGTAAMTAIGLGLLAFARPVWIRALVVPAVILAPHLIGAPLPDLNDGVGPVPQELAARYVVWSLATTLFFWAVLGTLCGYFYGRSMPEKISRVQTA